MRLPFAPPLEPMLSKAADALPLGDGWQFEPKWDGFRTLVFRDGDEIVLQSRDGKPMNRYFPELVAPDTTNAIWNDNRRFFNRGCSGQWHDILDDDARSTQPTSAHWPPAQPQSPPRKTSPTRNAPPALLTPLCP